MGFFSTLLAAKAKKTKKQNQVCALKTVVPGRASASELRTNLPSQSEMVVPEPPKLITPEAGNLPAIRFVTKADMVIRDNGALSAKGTVRPGKKQAVDYPSEMRAIRDEKWFFVKTVWDLKKRLNISEKSACQLVASKESARADFPLLSAAGKNGANALHYANYRNWVTGTSQRPGLGRRADGSPNLDNIDVLLPNYYNTRRELYGDPAFWTAIIGNYLQDSQNKLSKIYRKRQLEWRLEYPDQPIPTEAMVRHYLKKRCPKKLFEYARRGENFYLQNYRAWIERDPNTIQPNEAWVADSQDCDFMIKYRDANGEWTSCRPKIVVIVDIKSEFVVSLQLTRGFAGNEVIRNAFAAAVYHYGRPKIFLTDNGTDYCKAGFTTPVTFVPNLNGETVYEHSIFRELAVEHHKAEKYNARAKYVERFFRELAEYSREARGYLGNKPSNRPATAAVLSKPKNLDLLMDELEAAAFIGGLVNLYCVTPATDSKYLKGLAPIQAFAPELRYTRAPMEPEEYLRAFQMPMPEARKLDPRGPSVTWDGKRYEARPEDRSNCMPFEGQWVMIKFEMFSDDHCFVYSLEGKYLGEFVTPEMLAYFGTTEEDQAKLAARLDVIRAEKKYLDAMLMDLTGGWHRIDAQSTYQLPRESFLAPARLKLVDSMYLVKGNTHNPKLYIHADERRETSVVEAKPKLRMVPAPAEAVIRHDDHESRAIREAINGDREADRKAHEADVDLSVLDTINNQEHGSPADERPADLSIINQEHHHGNRNADPDVYIPDDL